MKKRKGIRKTTLKCPPIFLTNRDKQILNYMFESRIATTRVINEEFFKNKNRSNAQKRLRKLKGANLIEMATSMVLKERYYYYITQKGLKLCHPHAQTTNGVRFRPANIVHDFNLAKVRKVLRNSSYIREYYTENLLALDIFKSDMAQTLEGYQALRPDAIFTMVAKGKTIFNTVELEMSYKSSANYQDIIQKYYFNEKISYIFFISKSRSIIKKVIKEEKKLYPSGNTKFYYAELNPLLEKKLPYIFKSCNGNSFKLE